MKRKPGASLRFLVWSGPTLSTAFRPITQLPAEVAERGPPAWTAQEQTRSVAKSSELPAALEPPAEPGVVFRGLLSRRPDVSTYAWAAVGPGGECDLRLRQGSPRIVLKVHL